MWGGRCAPRPALPARLYPLTPCTAPSVRCPGQLKMQRKTQLTLLLVLVAVASSAAVPLDDDLGVVIQQGCNTNFR
jgi:hypothetical protein